VVIAVAEEVDVVDRDHVGVRRLDSSDRPQQLLIADVSAILPSYPASIEGCLGDAHAGLAGSLGPVDAESILPVLVEVLEVEVLDASNAARSHRTRDTSREERLN
jgi:hypothetical protein